MTLRSELKTFFRDKRSTGRVALVVLSILVAGALLILIAGLSCNLSCSGNEGAAALVLILGTFGVIALLVVAIRAINKKYRRGADEKAQEATVRRGA